MSLFGGKIVLVLILLVLGLGLWTGILGWDKNTYRCTDGKHWMTDQKFVIYQVGRLQFNAYRYDCPAIQQYDPKTSHPLYSQPGDASSL